MSPEWCVPVEDEHSLTSLGMEHEATPLRLQQGSSGPRGREHQATPVCLLHFLLATVL